MASFKGDGRLRLLVVVGTRPEIIRLSEVVKKCRRHFDTLLAHTGQNYDWGLSGVFFRDLGLGGPDVCLDVAGADLGETLGNIVSRSYRLMAEVRPDALLVLGDTNSCLSALPAKRLHVPVFHMEAGNRCRDERLPEETNRRVVDVVADVNMAYSEHARRWLAASGCAPERTFVTGSPMPEVLRRNLARIDASDVVGRLGLEPGRYFLLSAHREENVDDRASLEGLFGAVNALAGRYGLPVLYSCHPRSRRRLEEAGVALHPLVRMHEPLGFHDYNRLQADSLCTLSDSGTLPEEAAFFAGEGRPFPAVSLRTSTERPEAVDRACFVLAGTGEAGLLQAVELAVRMHRDGCRPAPVPDYADENVSDKVVKIIQSYTGVVDRVVWGRRP